MDMCFIYSLLLWDNTSSRSISLSSFNIIIDFVFIFHLSGRNNLFLIFGLSFKLLTSFQEPSSIILEDSRISTKFVFLIIIIISFEFSKGLLDIFFISSAILNSVNLNWDEYDFYARNNTFSEIYFLNFLNSAYSVQLTLNIKSSSEFQNSSRLGYFLILSLGCKCSWF